MTNYVCTELVENTCQTWTEYNPSGLLPAITKAEANQLALPIVMCLMIVWGGKRLLKLFGG